MKPAHARHRPDTTAAALTAEAKRLGVEVYPLGGAIDALLWLGNEVRLCDWKTPGEGLTDTQQKLVARGCPVRFVSTVPQLEQLIREMRREGER